MMSILALATRPLLPILLSLAVAPPAFAHHAMGYATPLTFWQGLLSGLAHPVIGLDHLAAVIAVGCIAAAHEAGARLVGGFVIALMAGAALHAGGLGVPGGELLLAGAVIALGAAVELRNVLGTAAMLGLFALAGLISGYALGESIVGAQPSPLSAYFLGLAATQAALAFAVMAVIRRFAMQPYVGVAMNVRLIGAAVIGVGFAGLVMQVIA